MLECGFTITNAPSTKEGGTNTCDGTPKIKEVSVR